MIELRNLTIQYTAGSDSGFTGLRNLDLRLREGNFTIVVGANGSGKSTLLNVIAGLVQPDSGEVLIGGQRVDGMPEHRRSSRIGRIFQDPSAGTAPDLSLAENFRLAALRARPKGLKRGLDVAFRRTVQQKTARLGLGLERRLDEPMNSFSGGQRQALSLLMATFDRPDLLLLDEPSAALDPRSAATVMQLLDDIVCTEKITTLMVTHDLSHAIRYGDRIIQLSGGSIERDISGREKAALKIADLYSWFS